MTLDDVRDELIVGWFEQQIMDSVGIEEKKGVRVKVTFVIHFSADSSNNNDLICMENKCIALTRKKGPKKG